MRGGPLGFSGLLLSAALASGASPEPDALRSAWRYRRAVVVPAREAGPGGFAALVVPPEVADHAQGGLQDLRLVDAQGREVAYVVDRQAERGLAALWAGRLVDSRREPRRRTVWTLDFGEARTFDTLVLEVAGQGYAKRILVEASGDAEAWRTLREDAGIFDQSFGGVSVHHNWIELKAPATARYLRLTADDTRKSATVELSGATVSAARRVAESRWSREAPLAAAPPPESAPRGVSRCRLGLPGTLPIEEISIRSDDPGFCRTVALYEVRDVNGRRQEVKLGGSTLYRLRLAEEALAGEALAFRVQPPQGGQLLLEVQDGDSPPLRNLRAEASATSQRLVFPESETGLVLYYGNDATRAPLYDLEALRLRLGFGSGFSVAVLGPEALNPRFQPVPPLVFAAASGAPLAVAEWRAVRPLEVSGREDLYTFLLGAEDLSLLKGDYGDLRIANGSDRQVPYILESAAVEERVGLGVAAPARAVRSGAGQAVSRYRLSAQGTLPGRPPALALRGLELQFVEPFFSRPARVLVPGSGGDRGDRVVFSGVLARAAGQALPLVVPLDGSLEREWRLEIDEGDNAPLTPPRARGIVEVPRAVFKAGPGAYRVLLGNPRAEAPRYDIAALRQDVLAYSAVVVPAGPLAPNPRYRRRAGDYFREAPPTAVLWATLLAAVVALLALTVRILRQPPPPGP